MANLDKKRRTEHHIRNRQQQADKQHCAVLRTLLYEPSGRISHPLQLDYLAMTDFNGNTVGYSFAEEELLIGKEHSRTIVAVSNKLQADMELGLVYPRLLLLKNNVSDQFNKISMSAQPSIAHHSWQNTDRF